MKLPPHITHDRAKLNYLCDHCLKHLNYAKGSGESLMSFEMRKAEFISLHAMCKPKQKP